MRFLNKTLLFLSVAVVAIAAFALVKHIGTDLYSLNNLQATSVATFSGATLIAVAYTPGIMPAGALFVGLSAKNISRNANPKNIAGMQLDHYYAFYDDILTFPAALTPDFLAATAFGDLVTIPLADPFVMKTGKYFYKLPCTPEEGQVKSTLVGPTDSKAWQNNASFGNAGNNDALRGFLGYTGNVPVIILMRELNGTIKVVGTGGFPARLDTGEGQNGGKVSDGNTLKHSYVSYAEVPCPTYLAPVPTEPVV